MTEPRDDKPARARPPRGALRAAASSTSAPPSSRRIRVLPAVEAEPEPGHAPASGSLYSLPVRDPGAAAAEHALGEGIAHELRPVDLARARSLGVFGGRSAQADPDDL